MRGLCVAIRQSGPVQKTVAAIPGLALCAAIALLASIVGSLIPVAGSALPAVLLGVAIALVRAPGSRFAPGMKMSSGLMLRIAIVILGAQLSLGSIVKVGGAALPVMVASLAICFIAAPLIGRALGVERKMRTLIGVGTGICGASAIATVAPIIAAEGAAISYAVSTIFLFNLIAVAVFPLLGHALGMDPTAFGLLAGTAVNDTSSVVAAAGIFSTLALGYAITVKLVRTLAIIPVAVTLSVVEARREATGQRMSLRRIIGLIPWFLVGFLVVALIRTLGWIPDAALAAVPHVSGFLIAMAMAGVGLATNPAAIRTAGWRPLALGGILSVLVTVTTLAVMKLTGTF